MVKVRNQVSMDCIHTILQSHTFSKLYAILFQFMKKSKAYYFKKILRASMVSNFQKVWHAILFQLYKKK